MDKPDMYHSAIILVIYMCCSDRHLLRLQMYALCFWAPPPALLQTKMILVEIAFGIQRIVDRFSSD
jgi:hypothetical protein